MIKRNAEKSGDTWFVRCDCSIGVVIDNPTPMVFCSFCHSAIMIENIKEVRGNDGTK